MALMCRLTIAANVPLFTSYTVHYAVRLLTRRELLGRANQNLEPVERY